MQLIYIEMFPDFILCIEHVDINQVFSYLILLIKNEWENQRVLSHDIRYWN